MFFAAVTEAQPALFPLIFRAWLAAAILTSILGIAGYFNAFPGAEVFTLYGRAAGAFQDPNVFGPFLVLPGIFMLHRLMTGSISKMPLYAVPLLIVTGGIFFSFSRGAWGLFAASAILLIGCLFLQSASGLFRLRVVVMSMVAIGLLVIAIVIVLQIPAVDELFNNRAQLAQDYDSARLGRFARYTIGFQMALENPLGIGPLVFGQIYGEDTHDIWLKALMDYGWLGFVSWAIMIGWTIAAGFKLLFRDRPWQAYLLVRLCRVHRPRLPRHDHRHRPLAAFLSAARHGVGLHCARIPLPARIAAEPGAHTRCDAGCDPARRTGHGEPRQPVAAHRLGYMSAEKDLRQLM